MITIVAHGDSDGVVSASLVYKAFEGEEREVYFSHPYHLVKDLKEFAKGELFILDIAVSEDKKEELESFLNDYGEVTYIDHHPLPEGFSPEVEMVRGNGSTSELTFRYLEERLPEDYDRVALYGAIADYSDLTPWAVKRMDRWDKRQIYFEAGILFQGLEGSRKMHDFKRDVVKHLSENKRPSHHSQLLIRALMGTIENEELYKWVKENVKRKGSVAYVLDPPGSLGIAANYARGLTGLKVGVAAERRKKIYNMSVRSRGVNLNLILRKVAIEVGGSGGGHEDAGGARIPKDRMEQFLKLLDREVKGSFSKTR